MAPDSINDALNDLDRSLFGDRARTILDGAGPPFDISRPNIHDNKAEFKMELDAVQSVVSHCTDLLTSLFPSEKRDDPAQKAMLDRLATAVQKEAQSQSIGAIDIPRDLALRNVVQTGFFYTSVFVVLEMKTAYEARLKELKDQEKNYWSVKHRPPNYYARTIALRFARHYARQKQQRPTFGVSRDGPHASTDFGRALEQVFSILQIKAKVRKPAEWALAQLSEDDWNPPQNALATGLFGEFLGRGIPPNRKGRGIPSQLNALSDAGKTEKKGR